MGRGLLPNMLNVGWGACVMFSLSISPEMRHLLFSVQSQEGGEREEGGCKKPGMGESKITSVPSLARTLAI